MMLVGLCGGIAAGKDTTYLRAQCIYGRDNTVQSIGYADKMKESVAALFGITTDYIELEKRNPNSMVFVSSPTVDEVGNHHNEEISLTFREFLQRYGTEAHRNVFGLNFWVDLALPLSFDHSDKVVFVTDVRFKNEASRIVELGGINILVKGSNLTTYEANYLHESEISISPDLISYTIDNTIRNDGFKHLDSQIKNTLDPLLCLTS